MEQATYNFLQHEVYGLAGGAQASLSREQRTSYAFAVLKAAAGDGVLSDVEREYLINFTRACGATEEQVAAYRTFDPRTVDLEPLLGPLRAIRPARALIYDAIRVSSADGYHDQERAAVERVATIVGVSLDVVRALEGLVAAEAALRATRVALLNLEV
jgi:tellurite resistance protein